MGVLGEGLGFGGQGLESHYGGPGALGLGLRVSPKPPQSSSGPTRCSRKGRSECREEALELK